MTYINEYISEEEWGISSPVTPKLLLRQWKRIVNFFIISEKRMINQYEIHRYR